MSFLGIVANNDDYEFIKNKLAKNDKPSKLDVIQLNKDSIENMKNVKFDTVAICLDAEKTGYINILSENILPEAKCLIINSDLNSIKGKLNTDTNQIITYGMNQKATVTTSSIKDDEVLICLQRNMTNFNGDVIEIQEFKTKTENIDNNKVSNLLAAFTIEQLYLL